MTLGVGNVKMQLIEKDPERIETLRLSNFDLILN